jgi:probable rRNA maturation factor
VSAPTPGGDLDVLVVDEQDEPLPLATLSALARAVLETEGVSDGWLTLAFVAPDAIAALKAEHLGIDEPTDVLSFPIDLDQTALADGVPRLLGDVIICPGVARANVGQPGDDETWHAATFEDELALLVVHGVLHLLGHDHVEPVERARMRQRERELLDRYHRG